MEIIGKKDLKVGEKCIVYNLYSSPRVQLRRRSQVRSLGWDMWHAWVDLEKRVRCWLGVMGVDNRKWILKKWGAKLWTGCLGPVAGFCK